MILEGIRGTRSFLFNRLLTGIWAPMFVGTVLAALLALGLGTLDRIGWSSGLTDLGGPFAFGALAAERLLGAALTIQIGILTLYFSITLLILTLGAQSLGARLIERWIAGVETRATLAQWSGLVAYSLIAQLFVTPEAAGDTVPRLLVVVDLVLTLLALAWLGHGYNQLARTAQVDTSIAELGKSFATDYHDCPVGPAPQVGPPDRVLTAWKSGYLGGVDAGLLVGLAATHGGRMSLCRPVGGFLVEGQPLVEFWGPDTQMDTEFGGCCELVDYRTDRSEGPFALSLLVEVAARALSPGINDYETAASCADWLGHGLAKRLERETVHDGWFLDDSDQPRVHIPETGVLMQGRRYLAVFNRWARDHPYVTEHLIRAYRGALTCANTPEDRAILATLIQEVEQAPAIPARTPREAAMIKDALTGGAG